MRVLIPDDILDPYLAQADATGQPLDAVVAAQLKRFREYPVAHRAVALSRTHCEALETMLGGGPLKSGADLIRRAADLASISMGAVKLDFTAGQLMELAHRAERQGTTPEALAKDIIRQISEQFFWGTSSVAAAPTHTDGAVPESVEV